jgi:hypothetical protein
VEANRLHIAASQRTGPTCKWQTHTSQPGYTACRLTSLPLLLTTFLRGASVLQPMGSTYPPPKAQWTHT